MPPLEPPWVLLLATLSESRLELLSVQLWVQRSGMRSARQWVRPSVNLSALPLGPLSGRSARAAA